jgi:hypothetical protein
LGDDDDFGDFEEADGEGEFGQFEESAKEEAPTLSESTETSPQDILSQPGKVLYIFSSKTHSYNESISFKRAWRVFLSATLLSAPLKH